MAMSKAISSIMTNIAVLSGFFVFVLLNMKVDLVQRTIISSNFKMYIAIFQSNKHFNSFHDWSLCL